MGILYFWLHIQRLCFVLVIWSAQGWGVKQNRERKRGTRSRREEREDRKTVRWRKKHKDGEPDGGMEKKRNRELDQVLGLLWSTWSRNSTAMFWGSPPSYPLFQGNGTLPQGKVPSCRG